MRKLVVTAISFAPGGISQTVSVAWGTEDSLACLRAVGAVHGDGVDMVALRSDIRVLLIDDQTLVREGLEMHISAEPSMEVVASVENCGDAIRLLRGDPPDIVLIEADIPCCDAMVTIGKFRDRWSGLRVVLMVTTLRDVLVSRAQSIAVDAIVTKYDSFSMVRSAILGAMQDRRVYSPLIWSRLGHSNTPGSRWPKTDTGPPKLTRREIEVLCRLAAGRTVKQTAEALGLAAPTIDNHKSRIMKKLDIHTGIELTRYAIREGVVTP